MGIEACRQLSGTLDKYDIGLNSKQFMLLPVRFSEVKGFAELVKVGTDDLGCVRLGRNSLTASADDQRQEHHPGAGNAGISKHDTPHIVVDWTPNAKDLIRPADKARGALFSLPGRALKSC